MFSDLKIELINYQKLEYESNRMNLTTFYGSDINYLDPKEDDIKLDDIAHGLSNLCRFAGQCRSFYSVAEHCLLVSKYIEHLMDKLNCSERKCVQDVADKNRHNNLLSSALLHDSAKAYVLDMPTPLKALCPGYKLIESKFKLVITEKFNLSIGLDEPMIKRCDSEMYLRERAEFFSDVVLEKNDDIDEILRIRHLTPENARIEFLERANSLGIC